LDFARRRPAARRPTNLAEVVERAARLLTPMAEKANVELALKIEEPEVEALVDGEQIMQVISNLIVNAVQAMPSGGSVTLELGRRSRSVAGIDKPFVYLAVRDTGVGMPPHVRDHVFEPFFTTKGVGGGTGLGLSVAHGIVEEQAGVLEVDSTEGKGSTFAVWLPAGGAT
jgi:signal transduction histidine kinase